MRSKKTLATLVVALVLLLPARASALEFLFFGADLGFGYANLRALQYDDLLPQIVEKEGAGPTLGLHAFLRLAIVAVGIRMQALQTDDFDVWHWNLEGQLRFPSDTVEIYLRAALGYAFLGTDFVGEDPTINGWDGQLGIGLDLYLAEWISIGPCVDLTFLNLTRSDGLAEVELGEEGSAAGMAFHLVGLFTIHI